MYKLACTLMLAWSAFAGDRIEQHLRWGTPDCSDGQLLNKTWYVICYQPQWKIPKWTGYHVTRQELDQKAAQRADNFRPDPDVDDGPVLKDYRGSGFDRGHQAPAGDFTRSTEAMSATFFLTNMAPQKPGLNRAHWRELEMAIRAHIEQEAWIFTGPDITGTVIGAGVRVPDGFFKTVLCIHQDQKSNSDGTLSIVQRKHVVASHAANKDGAEIRFSSLASIEKLTGLKLFGGLREHNVLAITIERLPLIPDEISTQALQQAQRKKK